MKARWSCKNKSVFDCAPFGGFLGIKDSVSEHVEIVTSGNKGDKGLQVYSMRS